MKKLKKALSAICAAITTAALNICAFAAPANSGSGGLQSSVAYTGTMKLLNDASTALMIAAPLVGVVCIIYFAIRHGAADEMDQKKWRQRIIIAIVSVVIALLAATLINVLTGYYTT